MAIFNSYLKLPEGKSSQIEVGFNQCNHPNLILSTGEGDLTKTSMLAGAPIEFFVPPSPRGLRVNKDVEKPWFPSSPGECSTFLVGFRLQGPRGALRSTAQPAAGALPWR